MSTVSGSSIKAISKLSTLKKDSKTSVQDLTKDDFTITDRVYIASNPDRLGIVAFNGTTKFSDGIWIGVILDKPFGKNNGVVQGVQYFTCEENHGIFVRSNNLRHFSELAADIPETTEEGVKPDLDQLNNSNLPKETEEFNFVQPFQVSMSNTSLNLGDRVYVSGKSSNSAHKNGILRFFGYTKFSDGIWAGIELDNPIGKNDGSVNGVRYFSCKPLYGLFALEHKVKKLDQSNTKGCSRMDIFSKYGSNESVSSIASNFSSASRTRVRLGMNAVGSAQKPKGDKAIENYNDKLKSSKLNLKDNKESDKKSSAIQNVLKEKEQHVEQLIREREIERIDLASATAKIEELERSQIRNISSFNDQKMMYEMKLNELQTNIYLVCQEKDELLEKLDESKKKVEDLLFLIEEKDIDESDLENKTEENESQIFELNEKLALEREIREQLEKKLKDTCASNDANVNEDKYIRQINDLESQLMKAELELNEERNESKVHSLSELLKEKESLVDDLQQSLKDLKSPNLEEKVLQLETELLEERNNSSVISLSKSLEERDKVISYLQERLDSVTSLNLEEKLLKLESHLAEERNKSNILLKEKESLINDLQKRFHDMESLNLEGKIVELESELRNERNNSEVQSLSKLLAEKEEVIHCLEERLEKIKSLNLDEKLIKLGLELAEERNNPTIHGLTKLLEDKEVLIRDLQERFEEVKSLNHEETLLKLESELNEERNNPKVPALLKLLEEKEEVISCLQKRVDEIESLNLQEKLLKMESELEAEKNNSKVPRLSNLLEEKEKTITGLHEQLENIKSCNFEANIVKLESEIEQNQCNLKTISKLLEDKEVAYSLLQKSLDDVKSLNLEDKIIQLETELIGEKNNFKSLAGLLEEKDETIHNLQGRLIEVNSLNTEERLMMTENIEENNNVKVQSLNRILEEKDTIINGLTYSLDHFKSLNLEDGLVKLKLELSDEKTNSKLLSNLLDEKEAIINKQLHCFEEVSNHLLEAKKEVDSTIIEKKSLESEILNLSKQLSDIQNDINQKTLKDDNWAQTEKDFINTNQMTEITNLKEKVNNCTVENDGIKSELESLKNEYELQCHKVEDKQVEYNVLKQKYEVFELENKQKFELLTQENCKLSTDLESLREQLGVLKLKLSAAQEEISQLKDSNSNIGDNENYLKIKIEQLESQTKLLEKENCDLKKSLEESEKDTTSSNTILQMSLKIDDLESSSIRNNEALNSEKEKNSLLISKNTTLLAELDYLKQRRDTEDNIMYDQLQSLKSINQLLECDKQSLIDAMESKSKEIIVIRDRLVKISQEFERLQEDFNENNQKFDCERRLLNDKIRKTEKQLDEHEKKSQFSLSDSTEKRKTDGKDNIAALKAAKENSEQQISFLNSVIGEREKKYNLIQQENHNLKEKIKEFEARNPVPLTKTKKAVPPRLYCDTCEIFDSHDTENCTADNGNSEPSSPQLVLRQVKVNAKAPRLYCDICEIFDAHDTAECQDQQTY